MADKEIGLLAGSLRKESNSKKIAKNLIQLAPVGFNFKTIPIGQLPLYNQDFDDYNEVPKSYVSFREKINELDGVIFITPEYNRSIPAVLKNAIDIASRPPGENAWNAKPGAIIGNSIGTISGFGANHHLRQSLSYVNVFIMQQPEAYLGNLGPDSFDENYQFTNASTQGFIEMFVDSYIDWFNRVME